MKNIVDFINESKISENTFDDLLTSVIESTVDTVLSVSVNNDKSKVYFWVGDDTRLYVLYATNNWSKHELLCHIYSSDVTTNTIIKSIKHSTYEKYMDLLVKIVNSDDLTPYKKYCELDDFPKPSKDIWNKLNQIEEDLYKENPYN